MEFKFDDESKTQVFADTFLKLANAQMELNRVFLEVFMKMEKMEPNSSLPYSRKVMDIYNQSRNQLLFAAKVHGFNMEKYRDE